MFVNASVSPDEVLHVPKGVKKIIFRFFSKYGDKVFSSTGQTVRKKKTLVFLQYNHERLDLKIGIWMKTQNGWMQLSMTFKFFWGKNTQLCNRSVTFLISKSFKHTFKYTYFQLSIERYVLIYFGSLSHVRILITYFICNHNALLLGEKKTMKNLGDIKLSL